MHHKFHTIEKESLSIWAFFTSNLRFWVGSKEYRRVTVMMRGYFLVSWFRMSADPRELKKWLRFWIVPDAKCRFIWLLSDWQGDSPCAVGNMISWASCICIIPEWYSVDYCFVHVTYQRPRKRLPWHYIENALFKCVTLGKNFERPIGYEIFNKEFWALRMRKFYSKFLYTSMHSSSTIFFLLF